MSIDPIAAPSSETPDREISELRAHKESEAALRRSERKYRHLFDAMAEGFVVGRMIYDEHGKAVDYRFTEVNQAYEHLTGIDRTQSLRKTIRQLIPTLEPNWIENHARVVETGEPMRWESYSASTGSYYDICTYRPEPGMFASLFTNITQRKHNEQVLRESKDRLKLVLQNSLDGIHQLDLRTGRYVFASPAQEKLTGFSRKELLLFSLEQVIARLHPDDRGTVDRYIRRVIAGETPDAPMEYRWRVKSGEYRWFSDSRKAVVDENGTAVALVGISRDITAVKEIQEELLRSRNELEKKVAERTALLEARSSQLQQLAVELLEAEEGERRRIARLLHDDLQQILAGAKLQLQTAAADMAGHAVLDHVDGLLKEAIAKSRRLSHELSPAVLHHSGLIAALEWLCGKMKKQFGLEIRLETEAAADIGHATLNTFLFRSVQELLFNISKHAGVKKAHVRIAAENDRLAISVSDSGRGFDPESIHTGPDKGGFGLLTIQERAAHIGGSLVIRSGPGQGSCFTLKVPLSLEVPRERRRTARKAPQPHPAERSGDKGGIRVLFADDHKVMRQGLMQMMAGQPDIQIVGEASNGLEAVEKALSERPDVIVMDISMPVMDGVEATRRVKAELPRVRVVALSMHQDEHLALALRQAGADAFVSKTASSAELLKSIYGIMPDEDRHAEAKVS